MGAIDTKISHTQTPSALHGLSSENHDFGDCGDEKFCTHRPAGFVALHGRFTEANDRIEKGIRCILAEPGEQGRSEVD